MDERLGRLGDVGGGLGIGERKLLERADGGAAGCRGGSVEALDGGEAVCTWGAVWMPRRMLGEWSSDDV